MTRTTIKDVAAAAGVSASAVSRVFTPGASVSSTTREKVLAAAQALGYRPNALARSLIGARTNLVALIVGETRSPFDARFVDLLSRELTARGKFLLLVPVSGTGPIDGELMQALDYQVDAVVVAAGTMSETTCARCVGMGVPLILSGRVIETPGVDCVLADNAGGGRLAADLFSRAGVSRVAYLGRDHGAFSDGEREKGLVDRLAEEEVPYWGKAVADWGDDTGYQAATRLLCSRHRPDAVFCLNDGLAFGVLQAADVLGLSVPDDVAVIGFDDIPMAAWPGVALTTVAYPIEPTTEMIADCIDRRLAEPDLPPVLERVPVHLVVRGTAVGNQRTRGARTAITL